MKSNTIREAWETDNPRMVLDYLTPRIKRYLRLFGVSSYTCFAEYDIERVFDKYARKAIPMVRYRNLNSVRITTRWRWSDHELYDFQTWVRGNLIRQNLKTRVMGFRYPRIGSEQYVTLIKGRFYKHDYATHLTVLYMFDAIRSL